MLRPQRSHVGGRLLRGRYEICREGYSGGGEMAGTWSMGLLAPVGERTEYVRARAGRQWLGMATAAFACLAVQLWVGEAGTLSSEGYCFLDHYLSGRPPAQLIFDSRANDFGMYQGRELSYAFDYLDCRSVELCVLAGVPHFLSIMCLTFSALIAANLWRFFRNDLRMPAVWSAGLVGLYLSSPTVAIWTSLGRSAKVGVTLCLVLALRQLVAMGRSEARIGRLVVLGVTLLAMSLFDRQGVCLVGLVAMYFALRAATRRTMRDGALLMVVMVVLGLNVLYTYGIGPWITFRLNGYWPDMRPLAPAWGYCLQTPLVLLANAAGLFMDTFRFAFGSMPAWVALAVLGVLILLVRPGQRWMVLWAVAALVGMDAMMAARHPPVLDPDMRRIYYWTPQTALMLMMLPLLLGSSHLHGTGRRWLVSLAIAGMLAGNMISLPYHRMLAYSGYLSHSHATTLTLLDALRELRRGREATGVIAYDAGYVTFRGKFEAAHDSLRQRGGE